MRDNLANLNNCAAPFLSRATANLWWSRCNISDLVLLKQQARNGIRTEWRHTLNGDRVSPFSACGHSVRSVHCMATRDPIT